MNTNPSLPCKRRYVNSTRVRWDVLFLKPFIKPHRQGSVFVCTFAGCVKQGGLKRDHLHVVQVFIDGHLNCKSGIWVHIRKGQQVRGTDKEVSMERVDGKTCKRVEKSSQL